MMRGIGSGNGGDGGGGVGTSSAAVGNLAGWEKHTKGIGSKLLQKFGFKGRLGANEDGIAKAIEVNVRPVNVGLGFGDVDAPKVVDNHHIFGEGVSFKLPKSSSTKGSKRKSSEAETLAESQGWKKTKYHDTSQKEVDDIVREYSEFIKDKSSESGGLSGVKIIDMRQKDVRIITDLSELSSGTAMDGEVEEPRAILLGEELLYNISKIYELEKQRFSAYLRRVAEEKQLQEKLQSDIRALQQQQARDIERINRLTNFNKLLGELHVLSSEIASPDLSEAGALLGFLKKLRTLLLDMYDASPDEFMTFGVIRLIPGIFSKALQHHQGHLVEQWSVLRTIISQWQLTAAALEHRGCNCTRESKSPITALFEIDFLPALRRFISAEWDCVNEVDALVGILETCQEFLCSTTFDQLIEMSLLPRLSLAVQAWSIDDIKIAPLHTWILPWLPLLTSKLSAVYPEVRRKISAFLRSWKPHDNTAIKLLAPWEPVFDPGSFDNIISRQVIPNLVDYIREKVVVNPLDQDLEPFQHVLAWASILPNWQMSCLLAGEFFVKWLRVLITWLGLSSPDFEEISIWYNGWKSMFPKELLTEDLLLLPILNMALDIMQERVMSSLEDNNEEALKAQQKKFSHLLDGIERSNYYTLVKQFSGQISDGNNNRGLNGKKVSSSLFPGPSAAASASASVKDVLEMLAEKNNLEFAPKFGKSMQGKPLYQFGKSTIYIENNIVFASRKSSESNTVSWNPIALQDLVEES